MNSKLASGIIAAAVIATAVVLAVVPGQPMRVQDCDLLLPDAGRILVKVQVSMKRNAMTACADAAVTQARIASVMAADGGK